jgi:hypothetical protein
MTCLNASLAALKRLWRSGAPACYPSCPLTNEGGYGSAKPTALPLTPDEMQRREALFYQRGLVLHKGCREKARAFADRHLAAIREVFSDA